MSKIYEALRQAELERAKSPSPPVPGPGTGGPATALDTEAAPGVDAGHDERLAPDHRHPEQGDDDAEDSPPNGQYDIHCAANPLFTTYFSDVVARLESCVVLTGDSVNPWTCGDITAKSKESNSQIHTALPVKSLFSFFHAAV